MIENNKELEKNKMSFMKTQAEKNFYLGEYKERVIAALTKNQIIEDDFYPEILNAMKDKRAYLLKMDRGIKISKLKPYIDEAEKINFKYVLVDGISYSGNIGLVVVSKEALKEENENIIIRDMDQDFIDVGFHVAYSKARGKKICNRHYKEILEKLPNHIEEYKKLNLFDKIIRIQCEICKKLSLGAKK